MALAHFRGFLGKVNAFNGVRNIFSYSNSAETLGRKPQRDTAAPSLFHRIVAISEPSIVPVLDQWIQEANEVDTSLLTGIIRRLRSYKRFSHALQISIWMSEKRYINLTPSDTAIRLDLIAKVHSIEEAENYFNNIPVHQRSFKVYGALLNCYANAKCLERAENVMHRMRELGLARGSLAYTVLLGLYQQTCNYEKMESLIQEMEEKHIRFSCYACCILINAYAAKSDTSRIDEILNKVESDDAYARHWSVYTTAAQEYMEAGFMDKAVTALRNAEKFRTNSEKESLPYGFLIRQYAKAGYREEVLRVWGVYKKKKVSNRGYICIISSLLKLDDIESAEQVFEEWKSSKLTYDLQIPNLLIGYYSRKGFLEKAEATTKEMISRGAKLNEWTWYYMASGYLQEGKSREGVEAMKEALKLATVVDISKWTPNKDVLADCLEFLEEEGNIEEAEEFVQLLEEKGIASAEISQRLLHYFRGKKSESTCI